mmetsp:Transcript_120261/g.345727  ORF Transcript_120261/g.345727 Transcript_120261/m.345727 type:complete len:239 (-) Transcript_120261:185-901(-)
MPHEGLLAEPRCLSRQQRIRIGPAQDRRRAARVLQKRNLETCGEECAQTLRALISRKARWPTPVLRGEAKREVAAQAEQARILTPCQPHADAYHVLLAQAFAIERASRFGRAKLPPQALHLRSWRRWQVVNSNSDELRKCDKKPCGTRWQNRSRDVAGELDRSAGEALQPRADGRLDLVFRDGAAGTHLRQRLGFRQPLRLWRPWPGKNVHVPGSQPNAMLRVVWRQPAGGRQRRLDQ